MFWTQWPYRWLLAVLFSAVVGIAAGRTIIGVVTGSVSIVDGSSMAPTYSSGARVFTTPISSPLGRGNIVLLDDGQANFALKRIVGLPGETVQLWRGFVFIDRRMLREPYLPRLTFTFPDETTERATFHLGADEYFMLGDNRAVSLDSRAYGPVHQAQIKSRVPPAENAPRARFAPYTLPAPGKRTIRPLA
jgi:signal peptidase I